MGLNKHSGKKVFVPIELNGAGEGVGVCKSSLQIHNFLKYIIVHVLPTSILLETENQQSLLQDLDSYIYGLLSATLISGKILESTESEVKMDSVLGSLAVVLDISSNESFESGFAHVC